MAQDPLYNVITVHHDKVLIVDCGSQVTQLIARRVREAGVYCEIAGPGRRKDIRGADAESGDSFGRPSLGP